MSSCRLLNVIALSLVLAAPMSFAAAPLSLNSADLARIRFEQRLDQTVSLHLPFVDETGRRVLLGDYFSSKPVLLVPGYYKCPMLCGLVLNGLVESLQDLKTVVGTDFDVIFVTIDPTETPSLAAAQKQSYLKRYGRPRSANGWHFLTGSETSIRTLTTEIGFHYAYDAVSKQYAHPSGFLVLTPSGKISRCFFGVTYSATELNGAIKAASASRISSPIRELLLLCFHYQPVTGKYAGLVIWLLRATAVLTMLGLVAAMFFHARAPKKSAV